MHSPETYAALNDRQAQNYCSELAEEWLGTERFKAELSRRIGVSKEGVTNWFRPGNRPPVLVILYMQSDLERQKAIGTLLKAREVQRAIERI